MICYQSLERWLGAESNEVFTDYQPQYPDLHGFFNIDFKGDQGVFSLHATCRA